MGNNQCIECERVSLVFSMVPFSAEYKYERKKYSKIALGVFFFLEKIYTMAKFIGNFFV